MAGCQAAATGVRIRWSKTLRAALAPSPAAITICLLGHGGAVASGKHARCAGVAFGIDHDFAKAAQLQRALEPFGVGHQASLHKHAFQRYVVNIARGAVGL